MFCFENIVNKDEAPCLKITTFKALNGQFPLSGSLPDHLITMQ